MLYWQCIFDLYFVLLSWCNKDWYRYKEQRWWWQSCFWDCSVLYMYSITANWMNARACFSYITLLNVNYAIFDLAKLVPIWNRNRFWFRSFDWMAHMFPWCNDGVSMREKKLITGDCCLFFDDKEETSRPIKNGNMCQVNKDVLWLLTLLPSQNVNINNILFHFRQQNHLKRWFRWFQEIAYSSNDPMNNTVETKLEPVSDSLNWIRP